MPYIYLVTNKESGKQYVGQTIKPVERRLAEHKTDARTGRNGCPRLHNAIVKYGEDNFTIETLEECSRGMLNDRETFWVSEKDTFKNGYNLTTGGGQGKEVSDETKAKISKAITGEKNGFYGKKHNLETLGTCKRIYQYKGQKLVGEYVGINEAARQTGFDFSKIAAVARGDYGRRSYKGFVWSFEKKIPTEEHLLAAKLPKCPVEQWTKDGEFVATFETTAAAAKAVGRDGRYGTNITKVCKGKMKSAYGYVWKYKCVCPIR